MIVFGLIKGDIFVENFLNHGEKILAEFRFNLVVILNNLVVYFKFRYLVSRSKSA